MSRQNDPLLHHVDGSFWKHVEKMDGGRMRCAFCGHEYAKDTSISRIKFHLAGVKGRGVRICEQVPQDVQDAALAAIPIDGPPEKKLETGAGSSNNEVTNAISASAQQQNNEMMMAHQREDLSLDEDWMASITAEDMEPLVRGSFHERPSFNQADEPRGDASQPTNDQLCSPSVNNDVIVNDAQNVGGVRTEPVVQQSNAGLDNLSVDAGRTQVGVQGMEQCGEEERVCSHLDMENTGEGSVQHVDRIVSPTIDENYNRREATERLVQHGVGASSFGVYGNHNAISTSQQEQNKEVDSVAGDAGTVPAVETMAHAPRRRVEEYMRSLEACLLEDDIDNGTGGVAQPGAGASSSGGLRHNPSETRWSYDVFLSFRGEDTRKNFIDHLHSALIQAGIHTFKDDNDLPRGEEISPQLLSAIEGSRISVVVFSRNYASSRWCLDELVKIMKCRQKTPHVVIPIFYHTDPSDVRKQTGSYAKAFDEHEKNFKGEMEKVNRWREALTQAGNLSGWDLNNVANGYEAKFIQKVVKELAEHVAEHPVALLLTGSTRLVGKGFEENKNVIWSWLTKDEVSTIGIYGMGGAGKTTMLKHIYNKLKISRHVYWVTVSQNFSIHKLQNKIADNIKLSFSNEEELGHRAAELSRELMKKQRWILILDDLWKSFELDKVGIPASLKGCKLLITTRSEAVCLQMNSKNNVRVNPLSNEEAWTLFMEVLATPLSPQVEQVARDITRECAGLPLGIKTIAGTMKGVDGMHEWSNTLEELKQSKVPQDKVEEEVFRILRFSYTHLSDEALQQCFLYCGLFPEDFKIRRENLIDYLIDEGVLKQQKSREAEINKGHTMLDRLERACLLERLHEGYYVKMHDLIRDMAIQILEENSQAIVKAGAQLKELPDAEEWSEKLTSVSLMNNQIEEICSRHSPRCPNLSTLFLCENRQLRFIADSFFKQLHGLKVLDLSRTNIECLPGSVSNLEGLTSLLLKYCQTLSSVPSLKKLRALKRLDLSNTPLKKIPHGMKYLSNLRYLRMNGCGEKKFPGGILPKLSNLQVFVLEERLFKMDGDIFAPVTVEGKEVGCLRKLESLACHFEDQSNYLEYLKSRDATKSLRTYNIVVGQLREDYFEKSRYMHSGTKMVVLGNLNINRDRDFLVIFSNDIQGLICKSITAGSIGDASPLQYRFSSCTSMESLVSSSWVCSAPLPQQSPSYNGIFSALKLLSCYGCKSMKKLFPSVLLPNLVNLEEIEVDDCEKMEEIIGGTSSDEEGAMGEESNEFKLPKLRSLRLQGLPELKSICSAKLICDSLQEIKVSKCNSMEILVPSSWSGLINMEKISVEDCDKMEEIIGGTRSDEEGVMGEENNEFKLPKLRKLILSNLPELKSMSSAKLICNSLEKISVEDCKKMEEIIGGTRSDERVMGKESIRSEFKLPKFRALHLINLPELKSICNAKLICDSLEVITVLHCEKLKRIPICIPLLGNGEPSHPPSLKAIWINPKEWWESTVEWEHPNAKDVLRPFVRVEARTSSREVRMHYRQCQKIVGSRRSRSCRMQTG